MESQAKYGLVGFVVIVLTVLLIAAVLWLSEVGATRDVDYYTIYFQTHSLEGLQTDSDVTMKGIKVGSVVSSRISARNIEQVRVVIRVNKDTPVKTDTKAVIKRNLLTGLATIELAKGSQRSERLTKGPIGEKYPVILEGETDIDAIASSIPGLVDDVGESVQKLNSFLTEENRLAVTNLLLNLSEVSDAMVESKGEVRELLEGLGQLSKDLGKIGKSLSGAAESANKQVALVGDEFVTTLEQIRETAEKLDKRAEKLTLAFSGAADVFSLEVSSLSQELKTTARAVAAAAEGFENPREIIGGPSEDALGPGERIRK